MENYQLIHGTYGLRREKSQAELEARQKAYPDLLRRHQERVTQALQRKQALEAALPQLTQQLADSKAARAAHYAQGVLFPKYRTFVLVCSLCELVQSGRCATLEGPQGAYQQLEAELQAGVDPHRLEPNPPPGGTVCRPGSSSSALPCSRPPPSL